MRSLALAENVVGVDGHLSSTKTPLPVSPKPRLYLAAAHGRILPQHVDKDASGIVYQFGSGRSGAGTAFETIVTDANVNAALKGSVKHTYRDVSDLITSIKELTETGAIWTSYTYDALKQIRTVIDDKNNVTTVNYDNLGRRTSINNPDTIKGVRALYRDQNVDFVNAGGFEGMKKVMRDRVKRDLLRTRHALTPLVPLVDSYFERAEALKAHGWYSFEPYWAFRQSLCSPDDWEVYRKYYVESKKEGLGSYRSDLWRS